MAQAPDFDLQSHSTYSDGALPPGEVVRAAATAGVRLLALTDHDTVDGVAEALAEGERSGVRVVPAVEVTAVDGERRDLHVLGYGLDHSQPALLAALADSRGDRERRAGATAERLRGLGYEVDEDALRARRAAGLPIGRPHLARAVVEHPANVSRLAREGLAEPTRFLAAHLVEGKPAFVPRSGPAVRDAIALIHDAGGVAVWAHPFWDIEAGPDVLSTLERFARAGLDGVEAFYITHTAEQTALLADAAGRLGLLTTGSSDFHGPEHRLFSRFRAFATHGFAPVLGPVDLSR